MVSLANLASYEDPELASLALEIAQELLPQVESLQKRSTILQNLVRAYRQVDGEVDTGLLRDGFVLADQLREEGETAGGMNPPGRKSGLAAMADQLEILLISELSKDSFDKAVDYVRSLGDDTLKLTCLIRIAQALSQPNY